MTDFDLIGAGVGPFNLSLAALADSVPDLRTRFFERRRSFAWHPGLMLPGASMQTSFLKDLVTPVCPTSPWSFVNFLVHHGRFNDFLAGRFETASRKEFNAYMAWVAHQLGSTRFGNAVRDITHDGRRFTTKLADGSRYRSRAVSVAVGRAPYIPEFAPRDQRCFHAAEWLRKSVDVSGRRVAVIGGGQTGAEIVLDLMRNQHCPSQICWVSRRSNFWTLQDGAFIDQFFTPEYMQSWQALPDAQRRSALAEQKYASDGITPATANAIYRELYEARHLDASDILSLHPGREVIDIQKNGAEYRIRARHLDATVESIKTNVIVLATGYRSNMPDCLLPLSGRIEQQQDGALALDKHYRVKWDGPKSAPLYVLNHGLLSHGIIDPQISLAAQRGADILCDLTQRCLFQKGLS